MSKTLAATVPKTKKPAKAKEEAKPVAKSYASFLTRSAANDGIRIPLYNADDGDSGHWIHVVGADSDIYRRGKTYLARLAMKNSGLEKEEADAIFDEAVINVLAECIIDWSFDEEATLDERVSLLRDAPNIRDRIEDVINSRKMFAKKKPTS